MSLGISRTFRPVTGSMQSAGRGPFHGDRAPSKTRRGRRNYVHCTQDLGQLAGLWVRTPLVPPRRRCTIFCCEYYLVG